MRCVTLSFAILLIANVSHADSSPGRSHHSTSACVWEPVNDVAAVTSRLTAWVDGQHLGPLGTWSLDIDRNRGGVHLQLGPGALTLGWTLDPRCAVTSITVQASPDFRGATPDERAVGQLVESLRRVAGERRAGPAWTRTDILLIASVVLLLLGTLHILLREGWSRGTGSQVIYSAAVLALLWFLALGLRLNVSPRTFLHEGYHVARTVHAYLLGDVPLIYGRTGPALFRAAGAIMQQSDDVQVIFMTNAVVASLAIPAVALLDLALLRSWPRALCSAFLLTVLPLHLRYSAAEDLFVQAATFGLWALALFALYVRTQRLEDAVCTALALSLAMQTRPEMLLFPAALCGYLLVVEPSRWRLMIAGRTAIAATVLALLMMPRYFELTQAVTDAPPPALALPTVGQYVASLVAFQQAVTPPLYWVFSAIGLSWGLWRETRLHLWLIGLFVAHTVWTLSFFSNVPYNLRSQLLPEIVIVLAGAGVAPAWLWLTQRLPPMARRSARGVGAFALVALGVLVVVRSHGFVTSLSDQQLEWAMLERTVPQLPSQGTLLSAVESGGRNLDPFPQFLLPRSGKSYELIDVRQVVDGEQPWPAPGDHLLFYQGMFCYVVVDDDSSATMTKPCRAVHERYRLVPLLVETLDTPGDSWQHYTGSGRGPFEVGFFRVAGPR